MAKTMVPKLSTGHNTCYYFYLCFLFLLLQVNMPAVRNVSANKKQKGTRSRFWWFLTLDTILNPRFASAVMKLRTLSNLLATSAILRTPLQ